ncbi:MAG: LPS assembly protein LptD [Sterolibacteriaceae bacterium MAG5]|nr:LPS assembly protein LptD [Candidatus Nitricoxidireducens bremensis]
MRALLRCLVLLGFAAQAAAEGMEPLRVDPALLGGAAAVKKEPAPAKPKAAPAEAATPAAKPAQPVVLDGPQKLSTEVAVPAAATRVPVAEAPKPVAAKEEAPAAKPREAVEPKPVPEPRPAEARPVAPKPAASQPAPAPAVRPAVTEPAEVVPAKPAPTLAPISAVPAVAPAVERRAVQPPAAAPAPARVLPLEATRTAGGSSLPPLRVDPALLRAPAPAAPAQYAATPAVPSASRAAVAPPQSAAAGGLAVPAQAATRSGVGVDMATPIPLAQTTEPPLVDERPALPHTYSAHVAAGLLPAPVLKASGGISPASKYGDEPRPTFVSAERMRGQIDVEVVAEGDAQLRRIGTVVNADKLTYWNLDDEVEALGNVRLERDRDVFAGPSLRMKVGDNTGSFEQPSYAITREVAVRRLPGPQPVNAPRIEQTLTAYGGAERVEFKGEGLFHLSKATYSTCASGSPDWYAEASDLELDYNRGVGEGSNGKLVFKGMPILYSPWLDFSLDNERKSGLLAPTLGSTSKSGFEAVVPWYWNIAPNMDATIAPRFLTKRGTQINSEFRYLDHKYTGTARVEFLSKDQQTHDKRWSYALRHEHYFGNGFAGNLDLNGVSDDNYFSDLSTRLAVTSQTNLLRQGQLSYAAGWWNATVKAQTYQTLQDPSLPAIAVPYRRLPQINVSALRPDMPFGASFNFAGEYVKFDHPTQVIGRRTVMYPQISLPMQTSYFQVTPKLGVNLSRYQLERQAAGTPSAISRTVPIFSLDSNLVFERQAEMFGRSLTQTLEPRLYYLYVPKREQGQIPVFDTGLADFNFAQVFAENRYSGNDRISDANQLTAAVTSRLIDPATGEEMLKGMLGQRYHFSSQHTTLPAVGTTPAEKPRAGRTADLLAALSGRVMPKTYVDTGVQYNPRDSRVERLNIGGRYQPETAKVLNAGYRYTRDLLGQVDVSGQWPIGRGWYGIGRYNFSTRDRKLVESVAGLEYNAGCWVGRIVVQRVATQTSKANTSIFLQLELNGFSRLGSNPLELLKRNIPGYGLINQPTADPAFGAQ